MARSVAGPRPSRRIAHLKLLTVAPLAYTLVQGPPDMQLDANTRTLGWLVTSEDIGDHEIVL